MKKVRMSSQSQSHDFDFFRFLKKVKVMTWQEIFTVSPFRTCFKSK
jgi:hypothetical protein